MLLVFYFEPLNSQEPNTLHHPHSFHSYFNPQLDSAGSV